MKRFAILLVALSLSLPALAQNSGGGGGSGSSGPSGASRAPGPGTAGDSGPSNRPESSSRAEGPGISRTLDRDGVSGDRARDRDQVETGSATTGRRGGTAGAARPPGMIGDPPPDTEQGMVPLGREGVPEVDPDNTRPPTGAGPTGRPLELPRTGQ